MPEGGETLIPREVEERPELLGAPGLQLPRAVTADARWISGIDRVPRESGVPQLIAPLAHV